MPSIYQKIHIEEVLPDWLRANLLTVPDSTIISSATSNYQRKPSALVLLDNKYALASVLNIQLDRSRNVASNTVSITAMNIDTRYSGPNKHKVAANVPVSVYFGYDDKYLQKFQGFIDTVSMTTTPDGSTIQIQCRDRAKMFIEDTISAGIYSEQSEYLGVNNWHFDWTKIRTDGTMYKAPRAWTVKDIIIDVCYLMGLKDLAEHVTVQEVWTGSVFTYTRTVTFRPEFEINLDPDCEIANRLLVANFIEEHPLDVLARLAQSIIHEVLFDTDGRLLVRPIKRADAPAAFYFKEERDLTLITENMNDDNVINVVTVVGQTANETAIIYPFAAVAVVENLKIAKGQDLYGQAIQYPHLVSMESTGYIYHHMIQAPVIYPGGQFFMEARNNPENNPQFDTRIAYPNFSNGYQKQLVMEGSCPIVTNTADWAPVGNRRRWHYYGALEEAVHFETQPIMLRDRFGKAMTVVCKERSINREWIEWCGNRVFFPDYINNDWMDEEEQQNVPTDRFSYDVLVSGNGQITYTFVSEGVPESFTSVYNGASAPFIPTGAHVLYGWEKNDDPIPPSVGLPPMMSPADASAGAYRVKVFNVQQGSATNAPFGDSFALSTVINYAILAQATKNLTIKKFRCSSTGAEVEIIDPGLPGPWGVWWMHYDSIQVINQPPTAWNPNILCVNCALDPTNVTPDGSFGLSLPYPSVLPMPAAGSYWIQISQRQTEIKYPVVTLSETPVLMTGDFWMSFIWMASMDMFIELMRLSQSGRLYVAGSVTLKNWHAWGADPDTNCVYWTWKGGYYRQDTPESRMHVGFPVGGDIVDGDVTAGDDWNPNPFDPDNPVVSGPGTTGNPTGDPLDTEESLIGWGSNPYLGNNTSGGRIQLTFFPEFNSDYGYDWEGNHRRLIKRDRFYELAQDPNVTIVELVTDGIDFRSSAELVMMNELMLEAFGHNFYGNMEDEFRDMMDRLKKLFTIIGIILILIGIALMSTMSTLNTEINTPRPLLAGVISTGSEAHPGKAHTGIHSHATGSVQGNAMPAPSSTAAGILNIVPNTTAQQAIIALAMILLGILLLLMNFGSGIGRNISKVMETMKGRVTGIRREEIHLEHNAAQAATWQIMKGLDHTLGLWHERLGNMQYAKFGYDDDGQHCWVYIMDLTRPGASGVAFPAGCWVTSFGWETPELGDRDLINFYREGGRHTKFMSYQFTVEGFGEDEVMGYSAEYLLKKRFTNRGGFGLPVEPDDDWFLSVGYEMLVDRSHTEVSVTDTGLWWNFFERREDFAPRLYKYIAVCIYSIREGVGDTARTSTPVTGEPDDSRVFASGRVSVQPAWPSSAPPRNPKKPKVNYGDGILRWGFWVSRGLNPAWYSKFRWLEDKLEQNYLGFRVLYIGQMQTVTHILNNFRYSEAQVDIRIWGKAYGKFAPTIIFYKETDQLSMGSYGKREMRLENSAINCYKVARKIANMLASFAATSYTFETTGKPHIKEGDIVHIKEETTGAAGGMFRTWENSFRAPEERIVTHPANMLNSMPLMGIINPTCACPTYGNNTLIGSGLGELSGTNPSPARLIEVDKAANPIWFAQTLGNASPSFVLRWDAGSVGNALFTQEITIVGMRETQSVHFIDYGIASGMSDHFFPGQVLCGAMDEEKRYLWVGHTAGLSCFDCFLKTTIFTVPLGPVWGVGAATWKVWDMYIRDYSYQNCGIVLVLTDSGLHAYQNFSQQWDRTAFGSLIASYSAFPRPMPRSMTYSKSLREAVVVNVSSANAPASLHGISVEALCHVQYPELGMEVEFGPNLWSVDFMQDAEMLHNFPDPGARKIYIDRFFRPVHAIRDIVRDLIVTDTVNNRVYRINPSGKFYITKISDGYHVTDDATAYINMIEAVTIDAAAPLMLTNFGKNFIQEKTADQIEAESAIGMGRIVQIRAHGRYLVKLLTSDTVVEAYNNSSDDDLRVGDTVIISWGIGGAGRSAILGKKSLWDWVTETGDPYISTDATRIDVSKYGQSVASGTPNTTSADYTALNAKIRMLEQRVRILGSHLGIAW